MASQSEHKKKYEENRRVLNNQLSIDNADNYNWITTIAFYSALHLVEAVLASYGFHGTSHKARGNQVNTYADFRNIRAKYKILHTNSINARYAGFSVSKEVAQQSLQYLKDIEKEIGI